MRRALTPFIAVILVTSLVAACGTAPVAPAPVVQVAPEVLPPPQPLSTEAWREQWLTLAEHALAQGRLTLPVHDNAYDRFQAVLMLDPHNARAQSGLHAVLLAYLARIDRALSASRVAIAREELAEARYYFPASDLLDERALQLQQLARQLAVPEDTLTVDEGVEVLERVALPPQSLAQRDAHISALLVATAQRVQSMDASVLILARSDAEGRWIYKTMRESVGDYRIRGDIRIDRQPTVLLLSPL